MLLTTEPHQPGQVNIFSLQHTHTYCQEKKLKRHEEVIPRRKNANLWENVYLTWLILKKIQITTHHFFHFLHWSTNLKTLTLNVDKCKDAGIPVQAVTLEIVTAVFSTAYRELRTWHPWCFRGLSPEERAPGDNKAMQTETFVTDLLRVVKTCNTPVFSDSGLTSYTATHSSVDCWMVMKINGYTDHTE